MPRLDRFIRTRLNIARKDVRLILAQQRVQVDGAVAVDMSLIVGAFSRIQLDGEFIQDVAPRYVMLNKPAGYVSATSDNIHPTVLDLIDLPSKHELHIVGRLDFNSTGLLLLTNDGTWSRQLSLPGNNMVKRYRVTLQKPLSPQYVDAFQRGMYFEFEGVTTRPADLKILSEFEADVGLVEGRYHQIKRMFGRFDNKVLALHRYAVGSLTLDAELVAGASRALTAAELATLNS